MDWIHNYQLFLFDFDGLLVNTEEIHYRAYIRMCANRGIHLNWDFPRYSNAAHHHATGLRDQIYREYPGLHTQEPNWTILYEEKKHAFMQLIEEGAVPLMPGVAPLLHALEEAKIPRCVVTHSALPLIQMIRKQNPVLNSIPHWITREDYQEPKPSPECYQVAIARLAKERDRVIGFEDSPRGLNALLGTPATPVLICSSDYSYVQEIVTPNIRYYPSFTAINDKDHP